MRRLVFSWFSLDHRDHQREPDFRVSNLSRSVWLFLITAHRGADGSAFAAIADYVGVNPDSLHYAPPRNRSSDLLVLR
jgi:hypothetical protein